MSHKIFVVDDEPVIREILEFNLFNEGFEITCACSAEEALSKLTAEHSLILLDIMMDGMSGYKLAETLRQKNNQIPIIFLTAKDTENDMLTGFAVGGDDYILKPFSIKEVIARVKAVLKRHQITINKSNDNNIICGDIVVNLQLKELTIDTEKILLTKTEFKILMLLIENPNRLFSRSDIIDAVWEESTYITERTVDVHITRLRKKIGSKASWISNRPGFGYRFNISAV